MPAGDDVRFWSWDDYTIEELWDYGFIEVSTNGGSSWTQLVVRDEAGNEVSTNNDPNGRLADFGNLKNGLTGATDGYRHDWVDLAPYAGQTIQLRLRYLTDAAFQERGWFADDFSVTADGTAVWSATLRRGPRTTRPADRRPDPRVEQYTSPVGNFSGSIAACVRVRHAVQGPRRADGGLHAVQRARHGPVVPGRGLLEQRRGEPPDRPAEHRGEGTVLVVDAHPNPEHFRGAAAEANPSLLDALPGRQQAMDAAFGRVGRYPFQACFKTNPDPARYFEVACNRFGFRWGQAAFTDAIGWYPGFEYRPDLNPDSPLFFRDADASVVVPSKDNQVYSTRVTDKNGRLLPSQFGIGLGGGNVTGTGNPADGLPAGDDGTPGTSEDLSLGVRLSVKSARPKSARVTVWPGHRAR